MRFHVVFGPDGPRLEALPNAQFVGIKQVQKPFSWNEVDPADPLTWASHAIAARNTGHRFHKPEIDAVNLLGNTNGCSTCDATEPGTPEGNWVKDHFPDSSTLPSCRGGYNAADAWRECEDDGCPRHTALQILRPQCWDCSLAQGGGRNKAVRDAAPNERRVDSTEPAHRPQANVIDLRAEIARRAALSDPPTQEQLIEQDRLVYGTGYGRMVDGKIQHIPAQDVIATYRTEDEDDDAAAERVHDAILENDQAELSSSFSPSLQPSLSAPPRGAQKQSMHCMNPETCNPDKGAQGCICECTSCRFAAGSGTAEYLPRVAVAAAGRATKVTAENEHRGEEADQANDYGATTLLPRGAQPGSQQHQAARIVGVEHDLAPYATHTVDVDPALDTRSVGVARPVVPADRSAISQVRSNSLQIYEQTPAQRSGMELLDKLPGVVCSNCAMSGECPAYQEGSVCAFTPAFRSLPIRDVDSHFAILENLLEVDRERTLRAVLLERVQAGGQIDPRVSQQLDRFAARLREFRELRAGSKPAGVSFSASLHAEASGVPQVNSAASALLDLFRPRNNSPGANGEVADPSDAESMPNDPARRPPIDVG